MFETDLRNLASLIIAEAIKTGTAFPDKVDAFKAATAYYGLLLKNKELKSDEDASTGPSFADFTEAVSGPPRDSGVKEHPNGGTKTVRTRARRRGDSGIDRAPGDD